MKEYKKKKARRVFKMILRALAALIGFEITPKEVEPKQNNKDGQ